MRLGFIGIILGKSAAMASVFVVLFGQSSVIAQPTSPAKAWTPIANALVERPGAVAWKQSPDRGNYFQLNAPTLLESLVRVVPGEPAAAKRLGIVIDLPMPDGTTAQFGIVESRVMAPELAAKFPQIKTYAGQGIDDPEASVRLDVSPAGVHAQVLSPRGVVYVDPVFRGDAETHVSYFKRDYRRVADNFRCYVEEQNLPAGPEKSGMELRTLSGATLRTYRLAVAATGEYTEFFGGTVPDSMAAIVTAINRVNGIFETELAVRLVLVANNDLIVYTDEVTDGYSNFNGGALLDQNQSNLDLVIGSANYDIGHVFSTGGGGVATLGCVCVNSVKARGVTGSPSPVGDAFWIDYVAHEVGHQFGAQHTFNSQTGSCSGGTRNSSTAYEPGSGSTIMAYAGICSPNDLQEHSDPYFHAISIDQIQTFLGGSGGSCAVATSTGNNAPTVNAGAAYTIPQSTPFALTAIGSDTDGDPLTYCWEERDLGPATSLTTSDNGSSPLFRSLLPTSSPVRFFPKLSSILANTNWNQEQLPSSSRTMNFRVTARDNRSGGGGVADADTTITIVSAAGPFVVTAPNTAATVSNSLNVTWNVAGTTASPISAAAVNIYLSIDGGNTFPYQLATNAANSGSATVALPNLLTTAARIKVMGAGNIFFDISNTDFTILPAQALVQILSTSLIAESCAPTNSAMDPNETVTVNFTLRNIGGTPTTNLVATLLATNGIFFTNQSQTYGVLAAGGGTGTQSFTFTPSGSCGGSVTGLVQFSDGLANVGSSSPVFTLGSFVLSTQVFANLNLLTIPDTGAASPYPWDIVVSGVTGIVTSVRATLTGFSHQYPSDVDAILVAPNGQSVKLISDCGDFTDAVNLTFVFDDAASFFLPPVGGHSSGTFRPTDYDVDFDPFPPPAPTAATGTTLSPLSTIPNGTWSLYVIDEYEVDEGSISSWSLSLITQVPSCCATFPAPTFTSTSYSSNLVRLNWNSLPGPNYQVQYRTNLATGPWQNLGAALPGTNGLLSITDSITNGPIRFYRVMVGP